MSRITYDVKVPPKCADNGIYVKDFRDFYESEHGNACIEYKDTDTAWKAQKAMCMLRNREDIYDVLLTRRKNCLYLVRTKEGEPC